MQNIFRTRGLVDLVEASKHYPHLKKQWVEFLGERPDEETTRVEMGETAAVWRHTQWSSEKSGRSG